MATRLRRLEAAEHATDLRDVRLALTEAAQQGTVPLETVLRKSELDHLLAEPALRTSSPHRGARTRISAKRPRKANRRR